MAVSPPAAGSPTGAAPAEAGADAARRLRLLHTSDWHLGASLHNASREPEQARFLDWLVDTVEAERVDALVVAGDIFDHAQPSAEALEMYFHLLRRLGDVPSLRKVVVVAGNHDSPSRLDAPREILEALRVHVVGGLRSDEASWDRCLCPIPDDRGGALGVVVAVPFVHEFRLGVRTTAGDTAAVQARFREAVTHLYATLAAHARARWPGVPLIATGHLTCVGARQDDYQTMIHQVGTLGNLPADVFDPAYDYVALGHIHRAFPVAPAPPGEAPGGGPRSSRVWYSGAPLASRFTDAAVPRVVLRVDIAPPPDRASGAGKADDDAPTEGRAEVTVRELAVPTWRRLVRIHGSPEEVLGELHDVTWDPAHELPPLVGVEVLVDSYVPGLAARLHEALAQAAATAGAPRGQGPVLADHTQRLRRAADEDDAGDDEAHAPRLRDVTPEEVFVRLCQEAGLAPDDALLGAFRQLVTEQQQSEGTHEGEALEERR